MATSLGDRSVEGPELGTRAKRFHCAQATSEGGADSFLAPYRKHLAERPGPRPTVDRRAWNTTREGDRRSGLLYPVVDPQVEVTMVDRRSPPPITITPKAREALRTALAAQPAGSAVFVYVADPRAPRPDLSIRTPRAHETPTVIDGISVLIDEPSRPFLSGAVIDYVGGVESGFRIDGPNLLPVGGPPPTSPSGDVRTGSQSGPSSGGTPGTVDREAALRRELRQIFDPEIPMNILDLGLIYAIEWPDDGSVHIRMTMTSPGCPVAGMLQDQVQAAAGKLPGISRVDVEVVWDPPWGPEKMSDFAKRQFGYA